MNSKMKFFSILGTVLLCILLLLIVLFIFHSHALHDKGSAQALCRRRYPPT